MVSLLIVSARVLPPGGASVSGDSATARRGSELQLRPSVSQARSGAERSQSEARRMLKWGRIGRGKAPSNKRRAGQQICTGLDTEACLIR